MKAKLNSNLIMRVDDELKSRLNKIQDETGCSVSEIVRQCLSSFVNYYDKNKCVVLPLEVVPQKELKKLRDTVEKARQSYICGRLFACESFCQVFFRSLFSVLICRTFLKHLPTLEVNFVIHCSVVGFIAGGLVSLYACRLLYKPFCII